MYFRTTAASLICLSAFAGAGCRSLAEQDFEAKREFLRGNFAEAADRLDPKPETKGRDELLFLLDRGTLLHAAGRFDESNAYFLRAAEVIEDLDLVSVSEQAGTILINETVADYRGEDYERVLIPIFAALNYANLGKSEDALVECRRCRHLLEVIADKRGIDFRPNAFARYLSGLMYEIRGELNDAYIEYLAVTDLEPGFVTAQDDVLRLAKRLGFQQERAEFRRRWGRDAAEPPPDTGELVVLYECGLAPRKIPNPRLPILPTYQSLGVRTRGIEVRVGSDALGRTTVLNDVEGTMVRTLDDRETALLAKRAASIAAKEVAAYQIRRKYGSGAGALSQLAIALSESPDLRSWLTAPASLQVSRIRLPAGTHDITLRFLDASGGFVGKDRTYPAVRIEPGRPTLLNLRTID